MVAGRYVLDKLNVKEKHGFDINPNALEQARSFNIKTYNNIDNLPDNYFDKIISNHALEHVPNFHHSLKKLREKLKDDGIFICVVPHENLSVKYNPNDIHFHLYTFNQQVLGNSFKYCGYKVIDIKVLQHRWPDDFQKTYLDDDFDERAHKFSKSVNIDGFTCQLEIIASKEQLSEEKETKIKTIFSKMKYYCDVVDKNNKWYIFGQKNKKEKIKFVIKKVLKKLKLKR